MRSTLRCLILTLPLVALGCSHDQQPARTSGYDPDMTPASRTAPSAPNRLGTEPSERLDDAQIITIASAVNSAEVDQAKIANGKARNPAVRTFAQTMMTDHGQAVKDIDELRTRLSLPESASQLSIELKASATRTGNDLTGIDDETFDKRYLLVQIDEHRQALDTINTRLIPAAQNNEVKKLLTDMRPIVSHHLEMAKSVLDGLR